MKLTSFFIAILCLHLSAETRSQTVSLNVKNQPIGKVFEAIEQQTELLVVYNSRFLNPLWKVSIEAKNKPLTEVLAPLLKPYALGYRLTENTIVITELPKRNEITTTSLPVERVQQVVNGRVIGEQNLPLEGVSVRSLDGTSATSTDEQGEFKLNVPNLSTIVVTYMGYEPQEVRLNGQSTIIIELVPEEQLLEEVVIGYGVQRRTNVTGAVDVISNKQIENRQAPTVSQLLQGTSPGMTFSTDNHGFQPGAPMNINIRGIGSLNGGQPYVLIDGIPGEMDRLNPEDIASISVLKDAAASAIYGARAPYGVILITTKSGSKNDQLNVTYSGNATLAVPQRLPKMLDSYTFARVVNESGVWGAGGRIYSNETIDRITAYQRGDIAYLRTHTVPDATHFETVPLPAGTWGINQQGHANYDWIDEYYGSALNQKHNLSLQGGSAKTSFYISGGYTGQEGVLNYGTDKFARMNIMGKLKTSLASWWDISYQPRFMKSNRILPSMDRQGGYDLIFHQIARTMPTNAKYDAYGNIMIQSKIPWVNDAGTYNTVTTENWQTFLTEIRPLKNWKINADFAYQTVNELRTETQLTVYETLVDKSVVSNANTIPSEIRRFNHDNSYWTTNIYSTYHVVFNNKHNFSILAGTQLESGNTSSLNARKNNLMVQTVPSLQTASGEAVVVETLGHWSTQGYFARLNYDYGERYLLEMNIRRDGTSRFRSGNRWGTFPSISAGWNISNEQFWEPLSNVVNTMKIRGSWGTLGNQNVIPYLDLHLIPLNTMPLNWLFGHGQTRPVGYSGSPNLVSPNVTWETATTKDIGVDLSILNNRLHATFDWFERATENMIGTEEAQPGVLGTALPQANNATLRTRGWELSLRWDHQLNPSFSYYVNANVYDGRTFVTKYNNSTGTLATWYPGMEQGEIWGYTAHDLYRSQEAIDEHQASTDLSFIWSGVWRPGDVRFEDLNGDGKVNNGSNTVTDHGDLSIIGNQTPRFQYGLSAGFSWKGLDFSMLWKGVAKRDWAFNNSDNVFWGFRNFAQTSLFERHLDYFRDNEGDAYTGLYQGAANVNTDAYWPRAYSNDNQNIRNRQPSTRYLQNAAYLRLQNVQIGYTIPATKTQQWKIQKIRVFMSGENLLTLTKLPAGIDPIAITSAWGAGKTYGADRMFSMGLLLTY